MALSEAFLKQTQATGDQIKNAKTRKQEQEAKDKDFLIQQSAPLFEALNALAALPRDKDGYAFGYRLAYRDDGSLAVYGSYTDKRDKPKNYDLYRRSNGEYEYLTSKFYIDIRDFYSTLAGKTIAIFEGQAWDLDSGRGYTTTENARNAQQLVDDFLAKWVGRNIPDAAARLAERKKVEETPRGTRVLQKLKNLAFG